MIILVIPMDNLDENWGKKYHSSLRPKTIKSPLLEIKRILTLLPENISHFNLV